MNIIEPLRLAVGSHKAGSGKGCAMNVISWENGDTTITDLPDCSDEMLARIVQRVNDKICTHRDGDLLCPSCSVKVLDLAHRTVGTAGILSGEALRVVWVRVACRLAREVAHFNADPRVMAAIEAAETWCDTPTADAADYAARAARAAAHAARAAACVADDADVADVAAADAAAHAACVVDDADYAARYAAYVARAAANAAYAVDSRLSIAHLAIDAFNELTGHTDPPTIDYTPAYRQMVTA